MALMTPIEHEVTASYDALRFGLDAVKADIVGPHPLISFRESMRRNLEEKKRLGLSLTYGSAFNLRRDLDAQILSRFQRPPGSLPSYKVGYEALTDGLDDFAFEDYLNVPHDLKFQASGHASWHGSLPRFIKRTSLPEPFLNTDLSLWS